MANATRLLPDRYVSPRLIGRGGMGEIYLSEDDVLGRKVAVKLLDERFSRDGEVRQRFTREALTAAKLSGHPNIVTIFDVGECEGRPFIVMEYLAGGTLADAARKDKISHAQALKWLGQIASALDEAHEHGVVHRDVKPANLLLDDRGNVHVADFGIARVVDESTAGMTAAGTVLGTAGYLSPEQARGEPATRASDVYALGIVAYELLTGGRPFEGGSATEEAAAHINDPVPPASERGVGLPASIDGIFARVLAKDAKERYGHAGDFVTDLRHAIEPREERTRVLPAAAPEPTAPTRPATRAAPVRERRRYLPAVLAALAIAALAAGGVLAAVMTSGGNDSKQSSPPPQKVKTITTTKVTTAQGEATTVIQTTTASAPTQSSSSEGGGGGGKKVSYDEAVSLTDQATGLMKQGDYESALPLALKAYRSLRGSGDTYEAYSAYDAGKSYIELGDCKKGLPLLDASERIQGPKQPISDARSQCG